jgi:hypothetical protein
MEDLSICFIYNISNLDFTFFKTKLENNPKCEIMKKFQFKEFQQYFKNYFDRAILNNYIHGPEKLKNIRDNFLKNKENFENFINHIPRSFLVFHEPTGKRDYNSFIVYVISHKLKSNMKLEIINSYN